MSLLWGLKVKMTNRIIKRYETPISVFMPLDQDVKIVRYDRSEQVTNKTDISIVIRMIILRRAITYIGDSVELKHIKHCCEQCLSYIIHNHNTGSDKTMTSILNKCDNTRCKTVMIKQLISHCWNDIFTPVRFYEDHKIGYVELNKIKPNYVFTKYRLVCSLNVEFRILRTAGVTLYLIMSSQLPMMEGELTQEEKMKEFINTSDLSHKISFIMFVLLMLLEEGYLIKDILKVIIDTVIYTI